MIIPPGRERRRLSIELFLLRDSHVVFSSPRQRLAQRHPGSDAWDARQYP